MNRTRLMRNFAKHKRERGGQPVRESDIVFVRQSRCLLTRVLGYKRSSFCVHSWIMFIKKVEENKQKMGMKEKSLNLCYWMKFPPKG